MQIFCAKDSGEAVFLIREVEIDLMTLFLSVWILLDIPIKKTSSVFLTCLCFFCLCTHLLPTALLWCLLNHCILSNHQVFQQLQMKLRVTVCFACWPALSKRGCKHSREDAYWAFLHPHANSFSSSLHQVLTFSLYFWGVLFEREKC